MTEYRFGESTVAHCFCSCCGVKTHGRIQRDIGEDVLIAVCVSTLDLMPRQFAEIPTSYIDGRKDKMDYPHEVIAYL